MIFCTRSGIPCRKRPAPKAPPVPLSARQASRRSSAGPSRRRSLSQVSWRGARRCAQTGVPYGPRQGAEKAAPPLGGRGNHPDPGRGVSFRADLETGCVSVPGQGAGSQKNLSCKCDEGRHPIRRALARGLWSLPGGPGGSGALWQRRWPLPICAGRAGGRDSRFPVRQPMRPALSQHPAGGPSSLTGRATRCVSGSARDGAPPFCDGS